MDKVVIACNYAETSPEASAGALGYVCRVAFGDKARVLVWVRSRNGRWIQKWQRIINLTNFRLKTLPAEHPRYNDALILKFESRERAERMLKSVANCEAFAKQKRLDKIQELE